ncbi:hypothetical protein C0Q70_12253 [Pomacea canaliculata]|uniref:Uncharacterized protein n=1 Tax=Pomacea canaliculata TaxID=400727 RepID=A0A2T7P116_POMCA|nr:hypothetical protein C0Q70_12253 [Pomacea canaliculata]
MTPEYKARDRARKGRSERERKCVESLFAMMVAQLPGTSLRGHILLLLLSLVLVIDGARTGMSVRDFRSHASIQEVECRGEGLPSEVKLWSLTIFSLPERTVLAYVNPLSDQCVTMTHFSSCTVDTSDTRNSVLRILVADLEEEETRQYGCNATGLTAIGHSHALSWTVWVRRRSDDNKELAYVNPYTGECVTFHEFSSCRVDSSNTRNSRVRTLVADLEDGHSTVLGCNVTYFKSRENTQTVTWKVQVTVKRLSFHDYRNISSIHEVECWGGVLGDEVRVFSLVLFRSLDHSVLAYVNPLANECFTYGEFASCSIVSGDTRKSKLRTLVADLEEGEGREYGCNVTSFKSVAHLPTVVTWSVMVRRSMKSQFFRNITSLQEVECSGAELQSEVKLLFLKMIKLSDSSVLAFVNPQSHECLTYEEFSSCVIDAVDSKKTRLKILVSDLEEGESRLYGCIATTVKSHDFTQQITWNLTVRGRMISRDFRGIHSLQEVECSGRNIGGGCETDVSLKLFRVADGAVLAFVNPLVNECITFEEFSSCYTNLGDSRKTFLRVLVSDLAEGETRMYGCVATTVRSFDTTQQHTWNITIYLERMTVRDFRGFHNIHEVECWGGHLEAEMNILSLKLYELTNHTLLGYLNHQTRECFTFMEFSSCLMDHADTRRSRLRVLVSDLDEGDTRHFGCDVTSWKAFGSTNTVSLSVSVTLNGMSVRDFRGFESIQEVECSGGHLEAEVNILSLKLFEVSNQTVLGYLNHPSKNCLTFSEFSSCFIDPLSNRGSRLRILVSDLEVGMSVRDFRGFESIQEVECSGGNLEAEVNILSLKLFEVSNQTVLAYLNHQTKSCLTFA